MADEFILRKQNNDNVTLVSNYFIDHYMASANGEFVKIYLYLLRCTHSTTPALSISHIADKFDHTEKDVQRALKYWEKLNILHLEYDQNKKISEINILDMPVSANLDQPIPDSAEETNSNFTNSKSVSSKIQSTMTNSETPTQIEKTFDLPKKPSYSLEQLKSFTENFDIQQLIYISEQYLAKTLTQTELSTILFFYDELDFSVDLVEYLIEYCVSKGHKSIHYIEKVGIAWAKANIHTVSQAKDASAAYNQTYSSVMKAFGISGRQLVESELNFVDKWSSQYGFSLELIIEACNRTMQKIHSPSFEYAESILNRWHNKSVKTVSDLAPLDAQHQKLKASNVNKARSKSIDQNKFNNFQQRSYNYEQLERQLLNAKK